MEDTLRKVMSEPTKRHEEKYNLIKEIRASTDSAIQNQGASIKTLEIQIGQMSKILDSRGAIPSKTVADAKETYTDPDHAEYNIKVPSPPPERGFESLPSFTEANARDQVKSISATVNADSYSIRRITSSLYAVSTGQNPYYEASHIDNSIAQKEKDPGSFTLPCFINNVCFDNALVDLGASISVMPLSTYLNLGLGELAHTKLTIEITDRTVTYPKGIAKNVLVGIGKFVFPIDFIILDMPEDIKVPLILGRPFLSTARAKIDVFERNITLRMELDLEARLMGETLVLNRSLDPFFEDYIELNDLNVPLELKRNQVDDLMPTIEEGEVVEKFKARNDARMDSKVFGYPSDCYHDKKIHIDCAYNLKFSCMIGFEFTQGMITIHDGNDEVPYQMVRSHPRFKHHTNEQCNKIPSLLKVSEEDKMNGISHSYQKLKGFYKGVLNLGLKYIRDTKIEEWLICGHISVHEME
nr:hypothetical protein [Tanacetum cinerariifolium]